MPFLHTSAPLINTANATLSSIFYQRAHRKKYPGNLIYAEILLVSESSFTFWGKGVEIALINYFAPARSSYLVTALSVADMPKDD